MTGFDKYLFPAVCTFVLLTNVKKSISDKKKENKKAKEKKRSE